MIRIYRFIAASLGFWVILSPQAKDLFSCKNPCLAVNEHISDLLRQMILEEMQINSSSDNIYLRTIITIK
ncbi:hypothetical protein HMPREF1218_1369 [Hoylesella pleuritidis F0068]|uniref:Uncharacterized protein n=1 Tax=Hoylesella pleuritidis F0068 TaxID=1081904 RepID=U2MM79_9BACT|nr:hypothetical protein HMPREF1218_1369 [Hoylesella pleuritidis F0068]